MTLSGTGFNIVFPAEVAQVVEHGTENAGVDSSSLSLGTFFERKWLSGRASPCQGEGREFESPLPLQLNWGSIHEILFNNCIRLMFVIYNRLF